MEYEVRESARAKYLRLRVEPDGKVLVTKPSRTSVKRMELFVAKHRDWIRKVQEKFRKRKERQRKLGIEPVALPKPRKGSKAYKEAVALARALVTERLAHFNASYGFTYGSISIRNQKTRWGSCSAKNDLSFNYRIIYLPPELQDYIVVHELCHTKEHNHSERFWAQVERAVPGHERLRKVLRERYVA